MSQRSLIVGFALALALVVAGGAVAQTPMFAVFFDPGFTIQQVNCPGPGPGVLYVAGFGFNAFVTGAEFAVSLPSAMTWVADANTPPITIGTTPTGIAMGYTTALDGTVPVGLCTIQVQWVCSACTAQYLDNEIIVVPSPRTGFLGWTDANFVERTAAGAMSLVCPAGVPVETTTWGRVKTLFAQ